MRYGPRYLALSAILLVATCDSATSESDETTASSATLTMVVMDPLAKPLSCPCVEGYAQRDYDQLAAALEKSLGAKVKVVYNESLASAMKKTGRPADIVIGKQSVIEHDAKRTETKFVRVAMLTDKDGKTTQTGLFVVPAEDKAKSTSDLAGYRMFFGPAESDEKHAAALALLTKSKVAAPEKLETAAACDEGAIKILELAPQGIAGCAVISSYAKPLLEGCGQVKKGSLRVVGETEPVAFIAAYVNGAIGKDDRATLAEALVQATNDATLRIALETKNGFVAEKIEKAKEAPDAASPEATESTAVESTGTAVKKKVTADGWTGWRGQNRDATVAWLPDRLPTREAIV